MDLRSIVIGCSLLPDWPMFVDRCCLLSQLILDEACSSVSCAAVVCGGCSETCIESLPLGLALRQTISLRLVWCEISWGDWCEMCDVFSSLCLTETSSWLVEAFSRLEAGIKSCDIQLTSHYRGFEWFLRSVTLHFALHEAVIVIAKYWVIWSTSLLKIFRSSLNGATR